MLAGKKNRPNDNLSCLEDWQQKREEELLGLIADEKISPESLTRQEQREFEAFISKL